MSPIIKIYVHGLHLEQEYEPVSQTEITQQNKGNTNAD